MGWMKYRGRRHSLKKYALVVISLIAGILLFSRISVRNISDSRNPLRYEQLAKDTDTDGEFIEDSLESNVGKIPKRTKDDIYPDNEDNDLGNDLENENGLEPDVNENQSKEEQLDVDDTKDDDGEGDYINDELPAEEVQKEGFIQAQKDKEGYQQRLNPDQDHPDGDDNMPDEEKPIEQNNDKSPEEANIVEMKQIQNDRVTIKSKSVILPIKEEHIDKENPQETVHKQTDYDDDDDKDNEENNKEDNEKQNQDKKDYQAVNHDVNKDDNGHIDNNDNDNHEYDYDEDDDDKNESENENVQKKPDKLITGSNEGKDKEIRIIRAKAKKVIHSDTLQKDNENIQNDNDFGRNYDMKQNDDTKKEDNENLKQQAEIKPNVITENSYAQYDSDEDEEEQTNQINEDTDNDQEIGQANRQHRSSVDIKEQLKLENVIGANSDKSQFFDNSRAFIVPNIIHFIWLGDNELRFHQMLSILSAHYFIKPEVIYYHCEGHPTGQWWDRVKSIVPNIKVSLRSKPREIFGYKIDSLRHQADVLKLQILMEKGGIYLDTDVLVLRSFDKLRTFEFSIGMPQVGKFTSEIIVTKATSKFLQKWLVSYTRYYSTSGDYFSCEAPFNISVEHPEYPVNIVKSMSYPSSAHYLELVNSRTDLSSYFAVHLWQRLNPDIDNIAKVKATDSTYGSLARVLYFNEIN